MVTDMHAIWSLASCCAPTADQAIPCAGGPDALTSEMLLVNMRDANVSNMIVAFLRLATSAEIGARSDFFCPFVLVRSTGYRSGYICQISMLAQYKP